MTVPTMDFLKALAEKTRLIDKALDGYLPPADADPAVIHQSMRYSVFAGGKRLRPALTLAAAETVGGRISAALPAACAIELIHTYSLIHDDLPAMDDDELRRGSPTNHRVFGEDIAILAGDALFAHAFQLLAGGESAANNDQERLLRVVAEVARACGTGGLIGGQVLDLTAEGRELNENELIRIHRAKTGALFRAAIRTGAMLSGADEEQLGRLSEYADYFGLAFQITDDILDVDGDEARLGKMVGSDSKNLKTTYATLFGTEGARRRALDAAEKALEALAGFGREADFLRQAVKFVVTRDY